MKDLGIALLKGIRMLLAAFGMIMIFALSMIAEVAAIPFALLCVLDDDVVRAFNKYKDKYFENHGWKKV